MSNEYFFKIPDDTDVMTRLLWSIPSDWACVNGILTAPPEWLESGKASTSLGYRVDDNYGVRLDFKRFDEQLCTELPAFLLGEKLAHSIEFNQAGYKSAGPSLDDAIQIAIALLKKGYRGSLSFLSDCLFHRLWDNPARCSMYFQQWHGAPMLEKESGLQPARLHCSWHEEDRGSEALILPILLTCRELGLEEYTPSPDLALCA
jgi:hypothetical protein